MARSQDRPRPDPKVLLELAAREHRGKLTVFLGAAPGVGKTYAMLARAQRLGADGVDIIIGLVETHGRSETARLLAGLEVLPRHPASNAGPAYEEFDLDGALGRKPAIIIVDELAHTNAQGSRHPKRHQDIAELIAAGIDVWTALNIQHLESLSDLVSQIAGVPVRETVPDTVLKQADEIILVDLPPTELIERLNEGKIYLPDNAERAVTGFFKPATLTALRELALRRAADRVDDQMVDFLRQSALEGPWATGERLLVCVGPDNLSEKVVRTASRLASGLNARWIVLSLARPGAAIDTAAAARLDDILRLSERLGAEVRRATADDFVAEIFRIARRENITQIVLGRPRADLWSTRLRRSLPAAVLRYSGDIGVHFVPGDKHRAPRIVSRRKRSLPDGLLDIAIPLVSVAVITGVGAALAAIVALQNLAMLFLAAVVISAVTRGRLSAVVAAALSFVSYNFFFIEPLYTFTIARPYEVLSLAIFVGVAFVTGTLAAGLREHENAARLQAQRAQALFDFSRKLSAAQGMDNVLTATASQIQSSLGLPTVVLAEEGGELALQAAWPPEAELDTTAMTAARWAQDKREPAGFLTGTLPQVDYLFHPIVSGQRAVGVVGVLMKPRTEPLSAEETRTFSSMLEQAAIAVDRARLVRENAVAALAREGEKLQAALLSSLSHDLRTPLASITGAVTSLRQLGDRMTPATRNDLLASIEEEAGRLTRFVANLFDMTRIEAGGVKARRDALVLSEVINRALARTRAVHPDLDIDISLAPDLRKAQGDGTLLEQALFNLLDNARKYGGVEHPVSVFARNEADGVMVSVTDEGKGIPPEDLDRIFEKFYRRAKGDGRAAGTGLGLSIARGFIEAMGGSIKAESPAVRRRGTRFVIRLPAHRDEPVK